MQQELSPYRTQKNDTPPEDDGQLVSDESLVVKNHDGNDSYTVDVAFLTPSDDVAYSRSIDVQPLETIVIKSRLRRGVYLVEASLENGGSDSAACLIGSGPRESAMVETGNRTISVVEGFS